MKPVPAKAPNSVCNVDGQTYKDGDSMEVYKGDLESGECEQCTCNKGMLMDCHHIFHCVLNDSSCNSYSKKTGQCCPSCDRGIFKIWFVLSVRKSSHGCTNGKFEERDTEA